MSGGKLEVPNHPVIPFIEGDGTGPGHLARLASACSTRRVEKAYGGKQQDRLVRGLRRREGLQQVRQLARPTRPSTAYRKYLVGIKGPLTTPDRQAASAR